MLGNSFINTASSYSLYVLNLFALIGMFVQLIVANLIRKREFKVRIKFVALASMAQLRNLLSGKQVDTPQEALNIIDTVLRELAAQR